LEGNVSQQRTAREQRKRESTPVVRDGVVSDMKDVKTKVPPATKINNFFDRRLKTKLALKGENPKQSQSQNKIVSHNT
jgi:hypothetical protein